MKMADTDKRLTKVERLQAGGYVAPKLRKAKDDAAKGTKPQRRIAVVDKEGRVVGYRDLVDVTKKLAERAEIEFDVQPGVRPQTVLCEACNAIVKVRKKVAVPRVCWDGCRIMCAGGCGKRATRSAYKTAQVKRRNGAPWRCIACAVAAQVSVNGKSLRRRVEEAEALGLLGAGVTLQVVRGRIRLGWPLDRSLAEPRISIEDRIARAVRARGPRAPESNRKAWSTRRAKKVCRPTPPSSGAPAEE